MAKRYNLKNIRVLLTEGFTDEDLRRLCYDIADFRPVYDQFARNSGKAEIIDRLLEYADRTSQIENLLALVQEYNPVRYKKHQPYYEAITSDSRNSYEKSRSIETKKAIVNLNWPALTVLSLVVICSCVIGWFVFPQIQNLLINFPTINNLAQQTPVKISTGIPRQERFAKSYIPTASELPAGFQLRAETTTAEFPLGGCGGDTYEIGYINVLPPSRNGKALLFRTAVCPDESSASELFNSKFDTQWPTYFMESISDGWNGVSLSSDAPKFNFNFHNVDDKFLVKTLVKERESEAILGAMTTIVLRSKNLVSVITVYVQDIEDSTNQAIYYSSLVVEKFQGEIH